MSSSFFKPFYYLFIFVFVLIIFVSCFLKNMFGLHHGYTYITSYFGYRGLPTVGATTYHAGVDIGAPEGSKFIAICDGTITFADFLGGGGYTITLTNNNMKVTYCHVSPNFIVKVGDTVLKGQVIGNVGPKNVYGVKRKSI